jgi:poly(3-hydroxybutyrate) depolymerase
VGGDAGLEYGTLDVAGVRRGYWLARGPAGPGPLLVVLHGSGASGKDVATTFTGLATRAPAAGVTAVFPDGGHGWPGGPQFLPVRAIGPIPRHLDATGILLEMVAADS